MSNFLDGKLVNLKNRVYRPSNVKILKKKKFTLFYLYSSTTIKILIANIQNIVVFWYGLIYMYVNIYVCFVLLSILSILEEFNGSIHPPTPKMEAYFLKIIGVMSYPSLLLYLYYYCFILRNPSRKLIKLVLRGTFSFFTENCQFWKGSNQILTLLLVRPKPVFFIENEKSFFFTINPK